MFPKCSSSHHAIAVSTVANLGLVLSGMTLGFPSALLPSLLDPNSTLHVDIDQASWIASLSPIATPVGCLLGGPLVDHFGRRRGLQILNLPFLLGWLVIGVRPSLTCIYAGRILTGFASGLATIISTVYTTETVTHRLRTPLVTLSPMMLALGILIIYTLGMIFPTQWQMVAGISAVVTCLSVVMTPFLPESPVWLLSKNRYEESCRAMLTLRGATGVHMVNEEMNTLMVARSDEQGRNWQTVVYSLFQPEAYKPLFIMNGFFFFQQLAGVSIVIVYAVNFVHDVGIEQDTYLVAIGIAVMRLVSTFITAWTCSKFGRRPTAIFSGVGMSLSLVGLSAYLFHKERQQSPLWMALASYSNKNNATASALLSGDPSISWFPTILLLAYVLTSCVGFSTLPWAMLGEVFPTEVRGIAGGITACFVYFASFIGVKIYPSMVIAFGKFEVFFFFAASAIFGTIFVEIFLPETRGKTLLEIEDFFRGKGRKHIVESNDDEKAETSA